MKQRVSATLEKETVKLLDRIFENGKYRNKSHVIEEAIIILGEKEFDKTKK